MESSEKRVRLSVPRPFRLSENNAITLSAGTYESRINLSAEYWIILSKADEQKMGGPGTYLETPYNVTVHINSGEMKVI
jgi:hypothetical protein